MRLIIADDEPLAVDRLQTLIAEIGEVTVVGTAGDGEEAAELIARHKPDLALLDIRMPRQSGLSLAKALEGQAVDVVFVTAFDQFATQAFDVDAVDYLLKPVEPSRLKVALQRAMRRRALPDIAAPARATDGDGDLKEPTTTDALWAPGRHGLVRVPVSTIDWIEAARDYVLLHTAVRSHIMRSTMEGLLERLPPDSMVRISRSAIVHRGAVAEVKCQGRGGRLVVLRDGTALRVGATYAHAAAGLEPIAS